MIVPWMVEAKNKDGTWEPRGLANTEEQAQSIVRAGKALRRIQGVRDSEWRVIYMPKEEWS